MIIIDTTNLRDAIRAIASDTITARRLPRVVFATLESLEPLTFRRDANVVIKASSLRLPNETMQGECLHCGSKFKIKFKEFSKDDIGKKYAFLQEEGWQTYVFLYEIKG